MSLELPDFVGSARHAGAFAFDFLCEEEKQNKTKSLNLSWDPAQESLHNRPQAPSLGKAVSAREESSSNPTKATFLPGESSSACSWETFTRRRLMVQWLCEPTGQSRKEGRQLGSPGEQSHFTGATGGQQQ